MLLVSEPESLLLKCVYSAHSCLVFCSRAAGQGKFKEEFQQTFDLRLFFHDLLQQSQ
jgi:hypothetical protein